MGKPTVAELMKRLEAAEVKAKQHEAQIEQIEKRLTCIREGHLWTSAGAIVSQASSVVATRRCRFCGEQERRRFAGRKVSERVTAAWQGGE